MKLDLENFWNKDFGDLANELITIITFIIDGIKEDYKEEDDIKKIKTNKIKKRQRKELDEREEVLKKRVHDRILLKQITCGFISNLSVDKTFRKFFAADEFLEYMVELLKIEKNRKNFDWVDSIERVLAVLVNWSLITTAQEYFAKVDLFNVIEDIASMTFYSPEHKTLICRLFMLLSRFTGQPSTIVKIVSSKVMMVRIFLYFNRQFPELYPQVLKIMFELFKLKSKLKDFIDQYEINISSFVKEAKGIIDKSMEEWNRESFVNIWGLISASLESFPETSPIYGDLIPSLTSIVKDKIDIERKNSAVLLAKLARNEDNKKLMNKYHTMEVLMSLGSNLTKT